MRKIPTLFKRDENDRKHVTAEVNPECQWVLDGEGVATRKYDGTCVRLDDNGEWWARREVKPGKERPRNYLIVETDQTTGKEVGWEPVEQSGYAKIHEDALRNEPSSAQLPGTYELLGPKVQGNPEGFDGHALQRHADAVQLLLAPRTFDGLRDYLLDRPYEGIVWHHSDGRMAKLKKRDFV
jgi:hypothetical protein